MLFSFCLRCAELDSALVASQGVQDALANIEGWLAMAENNLKAADKPASLIRDRLDEQIRQMRVLQADIDSHEPSIQKMYQAAQVKKTNKKWRLIILSYRFCNGK